MKEKINKNLFLFSILILFSLILLGFISAQETNYSISYQYEGVQVTSLKYEPYPVNVGEYFDIWLKASLGNDVNYVKFELLDNYPFSIDGSEDPIRKYDGANSREIVMHYKVRVDENAVEGSNELKIKVSTSKTNQESGAINSFEIYVEDAQTDFDLIVQDSTTSEISLAIANIGKNTANSMIVRIPEQESYKTSGTNGQMVGNLESGDYTIVSFTLASVGRNNNPLIIQIDYTDEIGERRTLLKELDFNSGSFSPVNATTTNIVRGDFPRNGSFPGMQQKKEKWPYFLAGGLILIIAGFFLYSKYKKYKRELLKKGKINNSKEQDSPEWIKKIKDKEKK